MSKLSVRVGFLGLSCRADLVAEPVDGGGVALAGYAMGRSARVVLSADDAAALARMVGHVARKAATEGVG